MHINFFSFLFFLLPIIIIISWLPPDNPPTATDRRPPGKAAVAHKTIARDMNHVTAPRYQDWIA